VNDVGEIGMCVSEPSSFKIEIAIEQWKRCNLPDIYQVLAELIQAGDKTLCSNIHKLIHFVCY
jgi:hypothetical protein